MSNVARLKGGMPSIQNLNDILLNLDDSKDVATTEPPAPPSIWERVHRTRGGLVLPDDITPDEWLAVGEWIAMTDGVIQFIIGDWINGAKPEWGHGHIYEQAYAKLNPDPDIEPRYTPESLRNLASVAANIPLSFRNDKVSYTHYVHISREPAAKQAVLIERVINEGLTVGKLKAIIAERELPPPTDGQLKQREFVKTVRSPVNNVVNGYAVDGIFRKSDAAAIRRALDAMERGDDMDAVIAAMEGEDDGIVSN